MPRILVVESNPKVVSDRLETLSGQALGQLYAATLEGLRNDVETVVISPYDGDETPTCQTLTASPLPAHLWNGIPMMNALRRWRL